MYQENINRAGYEARSFAFLAHLDEVQEELLYYRRRWRQWRRR